MRNTRVAILGAGPAGLGAAWQLAKQKKAQVTVLERQDVVGGNAGSFDIAGIRVDYGSHRLHPACDRVILNDLKKLLGDDLLDRPRHGRIRLHGRWIHFPLKPQDLALNLPFSFSGRVAFDALGKFARSAVNANSNGRNPETFTSVLEKGLGPTICEDFYFPYAQKIWGLDPAQLSPIQAHRRVSAGSMGKMFKKAVSIVPGIKKPGAGRFYYPRKGYGQISEAIAESAKVHGAEIKLGCDVRKVHVGKPLKIDFIQDGTEHSITADHVWSTIPLTVLARITEPSPVAVVEASSKISYRAMVLIYLALEEKQWTPFDAHYFPQIDIPLTRLSEPKNYSNAVEPENKTVLCAELPCEVGDAYWNATDGDLAMLVRNSLDKCGLPIRSEISEIVTRRLPFAYPIYKNGYERPFTEQDRWADSLDGVLTFGRQGLFAHDNTHHALAMAYAAVECMNVDGSFDKGKWSEYRSAFTKHVVED